MPLYPRESVATSESKEDNRVHREERVILKEKKRYGGEGREKGEKALRGIISQLIKSSGSDAPASSAWSGFSRSARIFFATHRCRTMRRLLRFSFSWILCYSSFLCARCARCVIARSFLPRRGRGFTISALTRDADCANDRRVYTYVPTKTREFPVVLDCSPREQEIS